LSIEIVVEFPAATGTVGIEAYAPDATMVPPTRTANFAAMLFKNSFLSEFMRPPAREMQMAGLYPNPHWASQQYLYKLQPGG